MYSLLKVNVVTVDLGVSSMGVSSSVVCCERVSTIWPEMKFKEANPLVPLQQMRNPHNKDISYQRNVYCRTYLHLDRCGR